MRLKFGLQTLLVLAAWFISQSFNLPGEIEGSGWTVEGTVSVLGGKSRQTLAGGDFPPPINSSAFFSWTHPPGAYRIKTVVLDAGHGGKDPGCHGAFSEEKNSALAIILHLGDLIERNFPNIRVIYTRDSDVFIELNERAAIANRNKADLFISVHCNSVSAPHINGAETYVMGLHTADHNLAVAKRENAAIFYEKDYEKNYEGYNPDSPEAHIIGSVWQSAYLEQSILFASLVQKQAKSIAHREDKGVKQAGFLVLRETAMPAVLVESGYLTNRNEESYIASAEGQQAMGEAIFDAFVAYKSKMESTPMAKTVKTPIRRPYIPEPPRLEPLVVENLPAETSGGPLVVENLPVASVEKGPAEQRKPERNTTQAGTGRATNVANPFGKPLPGATVQKQTGAPAKLPAPSIKNQPPEAFSIFLLSWPSRLDRNTGQLALLSDVVERQENGEYRYYSGPYTSRSEAEKMLPEIRNLGFRTAVIVAAK